MIRKKPFRWNNSGGGVRTPFIEEVFIFTIISFTSEAARLMSLALIFPKGLAEEINLRYTWVSLKNRGVQDENKINGDNLFSINL